MALPFCSISYDHFTTEYYIWITKINATLLWCIPRPHYRYHARLISSTRPTVRFTSGRPFIDNLGLTVLCQSKVGCVKCEEVFARGNCIRGTTRVRKGEKVSDQLKARCAMDSTGNIPCKLECLIARQQRGYAFVSDHDKTLCIGTALIEVMLGEGGRRDVTVFANSTPRTRAPSTGPRTSSVPHSL
jgi:hypothetical protein